MNERRRTLAEVNAFDHAEFVRVFGPVFEQSPWIAGAAWASRPFASIDELHRALCEVVAQAGEDKQVELIRAHPDLVGRAALAGTLTPESTHEQASAGLDRLSAEEVAVFQDFNQRYRDKFGFPFVICARLNKKEAILSAFPVRLQNFRAAEIRTALGEIAKIGRLRLEDLVQNEHMNAEEKVNVRLGCSTRSAHSIAFVCSANVCRSPMAHAIFAFEAARRGLAVTVFSAGIFDFEGTLAARDARLICDRHETPMPKFVATHIANVDISGARRVFAMESSHIFALVADWALAPDRISLLGEFDPQQRGAEIDDPMGQSSAAFEFCYQRLHDCIVHYLDTTNDFN